MARRFVSASSHSVTLGLGALGFAFGPASIAVIARAATDGGAGGTLISAGTASVGWSFYNQGGGGSPTTHVFDFFNITAGTGAKAPATVRGLAADGWFLIGVSKATGTVAPRYHKYTYNTGTWVHADSASTQTNATPTTAAMMGRDATAGTLSWDGDIAAVAVWNVVLTDTQFETLPQRVTIDNWSAVTRPKAMWIPNPNPAVTLVDLTEGAANESAHSGTSATPDDFPLLLPGATRDWARNMRGSG